MTSTPVLFAHRQERKKATEITHFYKNGKKTSPNKFQQSNMPLWTQCTQDINYLPEPWPRPPKNSSKKCILNSRMKRRN